VFPPVARIERFETPGSLILATAKLLDQRLEIDHPVTREHPVGVLDLPRRFGGRIVEVYERQAANRVSVEGLGAAGMPVTRIEHEVDPVDAVDGLRRDRRAVDRAIGKTEELERDPDAHPVGPIAGELERVARS